MATTVEKQPVFVFGGNRLGIHGKGAALHAKLHHGAIQGQGEGRQGNSYSIPTKKTPWVRLSLPEVAEHVEAFKKYAREHPDDAFRVTAIGTGLAGFTVDQIGPLFSDAPENCILCDEFAPYRNQGSQNNA